MFVSVVSHGSLNFLSDSHKNEDCMCKQEVVVVAASTKPGRGDGERSSGINVAK